MHNCKDCNDSNKNRLPKLIKTKCNLHVANKYKMGANHFIIMFVMVTANMLINFTFFLRLAFSVFYYDYYL